MSRPLRVLLLGYYGSGNVGDELVLSGILAGIAAAARSPWEARAFSADPAATAAVHGIPCYPRLSMGGVLRGLAWADCLVLGGGSLVQDATSRRSALYYLLVMRAALAMRRRVFAWAQGFGPVSDPALRSQAGRLFSRARMVTLRDEASRAELAGLGVPEERLAVVADPAFLLPPPQTRSRESRLGVSVRPWPSLERTLDSLAADCRAFRSETGTPVTVTPFQRPDDLAISASLAESIGDVELLPEPSSPADVARAFERLSLVLGMRLHSLILAARAAAPFVGISYDPKVERFCSAAGMPCLTMDQAHSGRALELLRDVECNREAASGSLEGFAAAQTRLAAAAAGLFWGSVG